MKLWGKIILCLSIVLNIVLMTSFYEYHRSIEDDKKQLEILHGYYRYDSRTGISFDDEKYYYRTNGAITPVSGTYKRLNNNIIKLTSGKYKDSFFVRLSNLENYLVLHEDGEEYFIPTEKTSYGAWK